MANLSLRISNIKAHSKSKTIYLAVTENSISKMDKNTLETFWKENSMARVCTMAKIIPWFMKEVGKMAYIMALENITGKMVHSLRGNT
jgi:hypothetical protein